MHHTMTDEALVLRTFNVGETDRFCILLTKEHGKVAARARGVRTLKSRRGGGLLPLHRSTVVLEQHSFGYVITSATCVNAHISAWSDPRTFGYAARGIELVLTLTDEGVALPDVYDVTVAFLESCRNADAALLVPVFTCKLLSALGLFPSVTHSALGDRLLSSDATVFHTEKGAFVHQSEYPNGRPISASTLALLCNLDEVHLSSLPQTDSSTLQELENITQSLLGNQLGASLLSPSVSFALSAAVTPTCQ